MFRLYTPLLILQAFCLYHAYRNNAAQRWYWLIVFIPGIGCAIYLIETFYNRKNIESIAEGVKGVINTNYKIEQLEKALQFSETLSNKIQLADAYVTYGRYDDAVALYQDCLTGYMSEDPKLKMKLLEAFFLKKDYESTITVSQQLEGEKSFKSSLERVSYAWALFHAGKQEQAEITFKDMDKSHTNYRHRVEYCKFLLATNQAEILKSKITELKGELEFMRSTERKVHREEIREINALYKDSQ